MSPKVRLLGLALLAACSGAPRPVSAPPTKPLQTVRARPAAPAAAAIVPLPASARLASGDEQRSDLEARDGFLVGVGRDARTLSPADKVPHVLGLALENTARGEAPDMEPAGAAMIVQLEEHGQAKAKLELAPGTCSTIAAQGGLGVIELDAFLTGVGTAIVGEDARHGAIAVLGGKARCFRNEAQEPRSVVLHVVARRGAGTVLARLYARSLSGPPKRSAAPQASSSSSTPPGTVQTPPAPPPPAPPAPPR